MEFNEFTQSIKEAMTKKGIGLRELSRRSKIDASFLSKILNGERTPPSDLYIKRIAEELELDYFTLLAKAGRVAEELRPYLSKPKMPEMLKTIGKLSDKDRQEILTKIERYLSHKKTRS